LAEPYYEQSGISLWHGDVIECLREVSNESVHCVITSPPYWGLREYKSFGIPIDPVVWGGYPAHEHVWGEVVNHRGAGGPQVPQTKYKACQSIADAQRDTVSGICECGAWRGSLGLEPTPELYAEHIVGVFRELRRVLRSDGTIWLNLGDSYANDRKWGGKSGAKNSSSDAGGYPRYKMASGLKGKDLVGIPWRVAFALQADGWYLRSDIIWAKPDTMPESVKDRPTRSHEYIFLLAKNEHYYYDAEAIKEPAIAGHPSGNGYKREGRLSYEDENGPRGSDEQWKPKGPRKVYAEATSKHLMADRQSGQRRLAESVTEARERTGDHDNPFGDKRNKRDVWAVNTDPFPDAHFAVFPAELILPCVLAGCPAGGTILDPFLGAGTTALVAKQNGRKCIGIEMSEEYLQISIKRLSQEVLEFQ
jgi:DNA modification methylase